METQWTLPERRLCAPGLGQDAPRLPVRRSTDLRQPVARPAALAASPLVASGCAAAERWRRAQWLNAGASSAGFVVTIGGTTQAWTISAAPCRLGCELELTPRTLSPRNRVSIFYLFGIQATRPGAADQAPGVQAGGTDGKAPGVQARGKEEIKDPRGASRGQMQCSVM